MYVSQYASRVHLNDLWTNTCGLVSRLGTCFWDCRSCMCNEVWKVWGGQSVHTTLNEFQECERSFAPHGMRGNGSFSRRPHTLFAMLGTAALSRTHRSQRRIYSVVAAFMLCLLFRFCARLLALFFLAPLPFCRRNNETASVATALKTINLCKCTQFFVNKVFYIVAFVKHPANWEHAVQD